MCTHKYIYIILFLYYYFTHIITPHRNYFFATTTHHYRIISCVALSFGYLPLPKQHCFTFYHWNHPFAMMYTNKYIHLILLLYFLVFFSASTSPYLQLCALLYILYIIVDSPPHLFIRNHHPPLPHNIVRRNLCCTHPTLTTMLYLVMIAN